MRKLRPREFKRPGQVGSEVHTLPDNPHAALPIVTSAPLLQKAAAPADRQCHFKAQ